MFHIRDTGIGIPSNKLESIFMPFTQADGSTTRRFGGTGLGLSISKQLIALMGGEISVESTLQEGSCFSFSIEFKRALPNRAIPVAQHPNSLKALRILIVDDNQTSRQLIAKMVSHWGMKPACAGSTAEALAAAECAYNDGNPFSLFVIDCQMPHPDGFDLARLLSERPWVGSAPMVMLSSFASDQAVRCRELGITQLSKPLYAEKLLRCLSAQVDNRPGLLSAGSEIDSITLSEVSNLRILVAEDNQTNQIVVKRMLEGAGHTVILVDDGEAAVRAVTEETFDLVLMDIQMPTMDGLEATQRIRALRSGAGRNLPIIALTAHASKADRERCLAAGMNEFLTKPLDRKLLYKLLKTFVENREGVV
jgi:CheY-like chemotaxis protein